MSFTQPPGNFPEDFGAENPAGFIRAYAADEQSMAATYAAFQEAGGHMQESRFSQMFGNVIDTAARIPEVLTLDPFAIPGPEAYGEWETGRAGLFATQVEMQLFDRDLNDFVTGYATYITAEPHTPAEAEQWAMDNYDPENTGADYNQIMMGAITTGVWKTVQLDG